MTITSIRACGARHDQGTHQSVYCIMASATSLGIALGLRCGGKASRLQSMGCERRNLHPSMRCFGWRLCHKWAMIVPIDSVMQM
eukprot:scaffold24234_cov19-Tisochrysis_lutea.AAC.1